MNQTETLTYLSRRDRDQTMSGIETEITTHVWAYIIRGAEIATSKFKSHSVSVARSDFI